MQRTARLKRVADRLRLGITDRRLGGSEGGREQAASESFTSDRYDWLPELRVRAEQSERSVSWPDGLRAERPVGLVAGSSPDVRERRS